MNELISLEQSQMMARLRHNGVIPIVSIDDLRHVLPLADALLAADITVLEVTFRTPLAADAISMLTESRPQILVGAGTVLDEEQLQAAVRAGAAFSLSPGLDRSILRAARTLSHAFLPGFVTPSELQSALALGSLALKFFPAVPAGGLPALKAILAPFSHRKPQIVPTGGITLENLSAWLTEPEVVAVGGTWIAPNRALSAGDWPGITARAKEARERVKSVQEASPASPD